MEEYCHNAALREPGSLLKAGGWLEVKVAVDHWWELVKGSWVAGSEGGSGSLMAGGASLF